MSNATAKVNKAVVRWVDEFFKRSTETLAAATTFYTHAMLGYDDTGYLAKFDDTQSMIFAGFVRGEEGNPTLDAGTAGAAALGLDYIRPRLAELSLSGVAYTDIMKKVYASDDQTGVMTNGGTYGNLVGHVVDKVATGIALVELSYDGLAGHQRYNSAKTLAATGNQTLSRLDLNKTIFVPNTAALTVITPAIADTQAGDRLTIIKSHASDTNAITLDPPASETIDGATTLATLDAPYDTVILVSTGSAWIVLARDIA